MPDGLSGEHVTVSVSHRLNRARVSKSIHWTFVIVATAWP